MEFSGTNLNLYLKIFADMDMNAMMQMMQGMGMGSPDGTPGGKDGAAGMDPAGMKHM